MTPPLNPEMPCPCSSGKAYGLCCAPFHQGQLPDTAVQLMRSRYAAYALGLSDYIIRTTHPDNPHYQKNTKEWKRTLAQFSADTRFDHLDILDFQEAGAVATVTFVAHLTQNSQDASFKEKSYFEKIDKKWLYKYGQIFN